MSIDDVETCPTMSVPEAGKKYFGLGRNSSYAAANRGTIPTIKVGPRTLRVPIRTMERMVGNGEPQTA
jgi:hypothetical protein